jgi:hypothetical protein
MASRPLAEIAPVMAPPSGTPLSVVVNGKDWRNAYARKNWQAMLTKLAPQDEVQFQNWAKANKVPLTADYDMRGFWKSGGQTSVNPNDHRIHYSDTYKTPLHESFSGESVYADPASNPPTWNEKDQLVTPDGRVLFDERAVYKKRGY